MINDADHLNYGNYGWDWLEIMTLMCGQNLVVIGVDLEGFSINSNLERVKSGNTWPAKFLPHLDVHFQESKPGNPWQAVNWLMASHRLPG